MGTLNNVQPISLLSLLLGLWVSTGAIQAQQWCPPGAEWRYTAAFCAGACNGYVRMSSAGDTTVQGQPCTRIERVRSYTAYLDPTVLTDTLSELYTYSETGIVWMFDPQLNAFDTLYDFNASPGDSWQLIHLPEYSTGSDLLTVLDTGHISIDGQLLRWLSVEYHFQGATGNNPPYLDTLMERIGSNTYYMLPYDFPNGFLDGQEGGFFRCYSDNTISYQSPTVQSCDLPLGISEEHDTRPMILLYPNPGTDRLTIRMRVGEKLQGVLVRDALGRICLHETPPVEHEIVLDTERLPHGCYSIEVRSTHGQFIRRWIKE